METNTECGRNTSSFNGKIRKKYTNRDKNEKKSMSNVKDRKKDNPIWRKTSALEMFSRNCAKGKAGMERSLLVHETGLKSAQNKKKIIKIGPLVTKI